MFQVKYHMDGKLYRQWTCPPIHKVRGFWFWMVLLAVSTPAMFYLRSIDGPIRLQSLASMAMLVAVYRGILFRPMYADKQFRVICMDHEKPNSGWDSRVDLDETGLSNYMDESLLNHVSWDQIQCAVVTGNYVDFVVASDFIRLPRNSFTQGSAEELLVWLKENHPEVELREESSQFAN